MHTCLKISRVCGNLISNNGLLGDTEDGGLELQVDCRGHPIKMDSGVEQSYGDYENLILVGVWLAIKENGLTLYNLIKWVELPSTESDETKFITYKDIKELCDSFLSMLFSFKHRGAIEKATECFSLFCQKLLQSVDKNY